MSWKCIDYASTIEEVIKRNHLRQKKPINCSSFGIQKWEKATYKEKSNEILLCAKKFSQLFLLASFFATLIYLQNNYILAPRGVQKTGKFHAEGEKIEHLTSHCDVIWAKSQFCDTPKWRLCEKKKRGLFHYLFFILRYFFN